LYKPDLVIANAENAAHGFGLTRKTADDMLNCGIDLLSGGNHTFDNQDIFNFIDLDYRILRPANYPPGTPGKGWVTVSVGNMGHQAAVVSLMGRAFFPAILDCPFRCIDAILSEIPHEVKIRIIDFHAEATSEKQTLAWYLDGRVSLIAGTHTHVQTADERIFPQGTAYISDVGMTGVENSVLGMRIDLVTTRMLTSRPIRLEPAEGEAILNGVVVSIDDLSGLATSIERVKFP
jgi:hypothetical protein